MKKFLLSFMSLLCFLSSPTYAFTIENDTEDDVLIKFTFKHHHFGTKITQKLHLHSGHKLDPFSYCYLLNCIPIKVKDKHIAIPGFPSIKINSKDYMKVSGITNGATLTNVPLNYVRIINDTKEIIFFTHFHQRNLSTTPSSCKDFTLNPAESRLIRKEGGPYHYFCLKGEEFTPHRLNQKSTYNASELKRVANNYFRLANDTDEPKIFVHRYLSESAGKVERIQLEPQEIIVVPFYEKSDHGLIVKEENTIQLEGLLRQSLKRGDTWSASELESATNLYNC